MSQPSMLSVLISSANAGKRTSRTTKAVEDVKSGSAVIAAAKKHKISKQAIYERLKKEGVKPVKAEKKNT